MTRNDIIKLALDAGGRMYSSDEIHFFMADIERFAFVLTSTSQRKPLTYGEISKILSEYETNYDMIGFARAIEKAHGI